MSKGGSTVLSLCTNGESWGSFTQVHKSVCRYELVVCANTDCKAVVVRGDMEKHTETCVYSPTTCVWCCKAVPKCHIEVCEQIHNSGVE